MDATKLEHLKQFVDMCKSDPSILTHPSLSFFRDYIQSCGMAESEALIAPPSRKRCRSRSPTSSSNPDRRRSRSPTSCSSPNRQKQNKNVDGSIGNALVSEDEEDEEETDSSDDEESLSTQVSMMALLWTDEEHKLWGQIFSHLELLNCLREEDIFRRSIAPELADVSSKLEELQKSKFKSLTGTCSVSKSVKEYRVVIEAILWNEEERKQWYHIFSRIKELNYLRGREARNNNMCVTPVTCELADVSARLEEVEKSMSKFVDVTERGDIKYACTVIKSMEEYKTAITTNAKVVCLIYDELTSESQAISCTLVSLAWAHGEMSFLKICTREVPGLVEKLLEDPSCAQKLKDFPIILLVESGKLKACLNREVFCRHGSSLLWEEWVELMRKHGMEF